MIPTQVHVCKTLNVIKKTMPSKNQIGSCNKPNKLQVHSTDNCDTLKNATNQPTGELRFILRTSCFWIVNCNKSAFCTHVKAILQVLIYKALYDKSYLGSKKTMTSGEWTCLISFATVPLTCLERGGSEKFKMKIYVSSGIRHHTLPVHDRKVAAP